MSLFRFPHVPCDRAVVGVLVMFLRASSTGHKTDLDVADFVNRKCGIPTKRLSPI
jgi:hypothetical protein